MRKEEIKKGLEFKVPADFTVFKVKNVDGDKVTVSWMDNGVERFMDYDAGVVLLNFATKSWYQIKK